jgi:hypothetical protein
MPLPEEAPKASAARGDRGLRPVALIYSWLRAFFFVTFRAVTVPSFMLLACHIAAAAGGVEVRA